MITTKTGQQAEGVVAEYLQSRKFKIIARNWRRMRCEIDIIAQNEDIVHFVEVKFRSSDNQGDGLAYITPKKLHQMHYAAEVWCSENEWDGDYRLNAASVSFDGTGYQVENFIEVN
jgi:putative endonuclease